MKKRIDDGVLFFWTVVRADEKPLFELGVGLRCRLNAMRYKNSATQGY
jgi:hypothetical protein